MPRELMIFAAGFGKRMAPLTDTTPKPLIAVGGTTLLDHTLGLAQRAGYGHIVINTHYRHAQIAAHLAGRAGVSTTHEPQILETGGGLAAAAGQFTSPTVTTSNSDAVWAGPNPFDCPLDLPVDCDAMLLCAHVSQVLGRTGPGDFSIDANGHITRGGNYVYLGIQHIRLAPVTAHPETAFSLNVIWDKLIQIGRIRAQLYTGQWCDVGRPENIATANRLLAHHDV